MHPAGIFRDIAADCAGDLRRGIGCVIEARIRYGLRDGEVGDARFDDGNSIVGAWEIARDGSGWEPDLNLTYTRME